MSASIDYLLNQASEAQIAAHLQCCDADFVPPLSTRAELGDYAQKLASKATRFEAWSNDTLVGLVAAYCNDQANHTAYITSVSVLKKWSGQGIAARLVNVCIDHAKDAGMHKISLQVAQANAPAIRLYKKSGFALSQASGPFIGMNLLLTRGENNEQQA
jgi:ribosomal protein S18 acetylase RimI-like enzyme